MIGVMLMLINQFSGCFALLNYSATIFRDSGSDISPNMSSIIIASIQCVGTYVATILVDKVGRKLLLAISASATSVGLAVMGAYSFLDKLKFDLHNFNWVPVCSLSFVIFIASIGILPLPFIVLAEVLPNKVTNNFCVFCELISMNNFLLPDTGYWIHFMCRIHQCNIIFNFENISITNQFDRFVWMYVVVFRHMCYRYTVHHFRCGRDEGNELRYCENSVYEYLLVIINY